PAERDALFEDVDGLVLPSHFEGMPMSLLEAMSYELAVIATPIGAIPDVVIDGKNGLLVPVSDPEALGAAIQRLIKDPALCQKLGAEGRKSVEPFSMEGYAEHLISLYQSVVNGQVLVEAS
ncbi:MAG: glycosyltransferase, partial [Geminicoccaceae bacterium]